MVENSNLPTRRNVVSHFRQIGSVGVSAALVFSCVPYYAFASQDDFDSVAQEESNSVAVVQLANDLSDEGGLTSDVAKTDEVYSDSANHVLDGEDESSISLALDEESGDIAVQSEKSQSYDLDNSTCVVTGNKIVMTVKDDSKPVNLTRNDIISMGLQNSAADIVLADGVKYVGSFSGVFSAGLTVDSFTMPDSVIDIDTGIYSTVLNASTRYPSALVEGGFLYANSSHETILKLVDVKDSGDFVIPEGVKEFMPSNTLNGYRFDRVFIPSTLTKIQTGIFDAESVDEVVLAEGNTSYTISVTDANKGSLVKVKKNGKETVFIKVASQEVKYSDDGTVLISVPRQFEGTLAVQDGCTTIGDKVFADHRLLTNVVLPSSITSIGESAFANCSSLESVVWPESLHTIKDSTFSGCSSLQSFSFSGITSIGNNAFQNCSSLTIVELPDCVTSLGNSAFNGCTELKSVRLSKNLVQIDNYSDLFDTTITPGGATVTPIAVPGFGDYAFANCTSLESVEMPEGLQAIGRRAFENCPSLTHFDAPDSLEVIGSGAFSGTGLTSFVTPKNLFANSELKGLVPNDSSQKTYWDYWFTDDSTAAFGGQIFTATAAEALGNPMLVNQGVFSQILSLSLSKYSADTIGSYLFSGLNKITTISIPKNVSSIQTGAFFGCSSLKDIYVFNSQCQIAEYSVTTGPTGTIYSMPAFGMWSGLGPDGKGILAPLTGANYYGLAFAQNPVISYAANSSSNFIPFVVLDGADTESLFGNQVAANGAGYNDIRITDVAYTGSEVEPNIVAHFTDRGLNGSLDRQLTVGNGLTSVVYKDAAGNTLSSITAPGTYTATITGDDASVFGTKTLTFKVVDPSQPVTPSGQQTGGNLQPTGQQSMQQVNQVNAAAQQQAAAMPQTGDDAASAAIPATTAAIGALGALGVAIAAMRRKFGKDSE